MASNALHPVVLSGGSGTRLWPLSREHYPKQLLALAGEESLLQQTIRRLDGVKNASDVLFVCNEEHRFLIGEQARHVGVRTAKIILEPIGRNTCPAVTLAALMLRASSKDALMLVMPADHVIKNQGAFRDAIAAAVPIAASGRLVTFGIVPTSPATGYGYIRKGPNQSVAQFVEKPDVKTATRYVESGDYLWNSGMFMMSVAAWLSELARFAPDILQKCEAAFAAGRQDGEFYRVGKEAFAECRSDSIDYAVMEKTDKAAVIPLDAGWSDVGAWSALWEVSEPKTDGNVTRGDVLLHDTKDSLVLAQHRLVAATGLKDAIVIETADAVLVADRDHAQNVKQLVEQLKARKRTEHLTHRRVYRPWGYYESIDQGERFQVKRLCVNPGAALSLQMHHHRAEHWVVVKGTARVTRDDETFLITENQSTYISTGMRHRLENPGAIPLEIIEVQSGSYLGEDDIVRFEDRYNRSN